MRKRTKWILGSVICLAILGVIGYKWVIGYASDRLIEQVTKEMLTDDEVNQLMKEPAVQKVLEEQLGTAVAPSSDQKETTKGSQGDNQSSPAKTEIAASSNTENQGQQQIAFSSKEEALEFLLTRFSTSELKEFISMASGGVSAEEKKEIKRVLLERLSPEEFQALKVLGLIELQKRQQEVP